SARGRLRTELTRITAPPCRMIGERRGRVLNIEESSIIELGLWGQRKHVANPQDARAHELDARDDLAAGTLRLQHAQGSRPTCHRHPLVKNFAWSPLKLDDLGTQDLQPFQHSLRANFGCRAGKRREAVNMALHANSARAP